MGVTLGDLFRRQHMLKTASALFLVALIFVAPVALAQSVTGKPAPDIFTRPVNGERNVNLRNLKGNTIILMFTVTTKMVPVAAVGPATCDG